MRARRNNSSLFWIFGLNIQDRSAHKGRLLACFWCAFAILTDLTSIRIREITLTIAALWLAWHGGIAVREVRAQSEAVRQVETQLRELQTNQHSSAMAVETRLTKVETQLGILASSVDRLMWGVVGSFGAFIAQSLWSVITVRKRKGDTGDGA